MKDTVIIICSSSINSINKNFGKQIIKYYPNIDLIDAFEYNVEIYSEEKNKIGIPKKIEEYLDKILQYKNLIFITAEHNGYVPSFFKNILDWSSVSSKGMKYLENKNSIIVCASPGSTGGKNVREFLAKNLLFTGTKVLGTVGVPYYKHDIESKQYIEEIISLLNRK